MNAAWLGAGLAVLGIVLLAAAEFVTVYEVTVGSLGTVRRSATGGENHGFALLVVALVAAAMTAIAVRGAPAAAAALAVLGALALAIALAADLPDTRASGRLEESLAYEDARARAGTGLILELAGGALLLAGGGVLAVRARRRGSGGRTDQAG